MRTAEIGSEVPAFRVRRPRFGPTGARHAPGAGQASTKGRLGHMIGNVRKNDFVSGVFGVNFACGRLTYRQSGRVRSKPFNRIAAVQQSGTGGLVRSPGLNTKRLVRVEGEDVGNMRRIAALRKDVLGNFGVIGLIRLV